MIRADELCTKARYPLDSGWGYIWGKSGQVWTQAEQDTATRPQTITYGQQWVGQHVLDCSGLLVWLYKQFDEKIYHGSNTIWREYCSKQGKLKDGQRCDGISLRPGTAVFLLNDTGRHHVGLYVGDGICIEAKGTKFGVVTSNATRWDEWGELAQVDYSMYPEREIPVARPILRKGDRGGEVRELQILLRSCGYVLADDGIFGKATEAAVRGFQRAAGLSVDGVVGPKTWAALAEAVTQIDGKPIVPDDGQEPEPEAPELDDDDEEPFGIVLLSYDQASQLKRSLSSALTIITNALEGVKP